MTAQEAYDIIKQKYPLSVVRSCLEYDDFYLFVMCPINIKADEDYESGTVYDAVDKETGRCYQYDILTDLDAYDKAKEVHVNTIFDKTVH